MKKNAWLRITIFYFLALLIANPFRFDIFNLKDSMTGLPSWLYILIWVLLEGVGVLIGALVGLYLLKKEKPIKSSLLGTNPLYAGIMLLVAIILLPIFGVENTFNMNPHLYGFVAAFGTIVYCIMEEYGWRGYLQEELGPINQWVKYAIIGFMWYFWHLSFLRETSIGDNLFFLGMLIFASWGIGQVIEATRSIAAAACFHMIVQIMMLNSLTKNGLDSTEKWLILGISVVIWFVMVKRWEKENAASGV
jgi:hypothetical protein